MDLQTGQISVSRNVAIDFSTERILSAPPFPDWTNSKLTTDRLTEIVRSLRMEVKQQLSPRAIYIVIETGNSGIQNHEPPTPLMESSYLCCLLATIGECEYDAPPESMTEEMIRDAMENVALGFLKQKVARNIREQARENGWNTTRLFSPGSGNVDWDVAHSAFIFDHLPASKIGVSLGDGGIIHPPKSSSSVIGLGPDITQAPALFTCEGCPKIAECDYAVYSGIQT